MSQDQPIIHTESMHFGISSGIWIDCCILVCSLNSLCPWKSSASSGWNVNSCLEKEISHCNHNIIFIVWSFTGSLVSFLLINELSSCSIVANLCIPFQVGLIGFTSCWFSFLPSHLFFAVEHSYILPVLGSFVTKPYKTWMKACKYNVYTCCIHYVVCKLSTICLRQLQTQ